MIYIEENNAEIVLPVLKRCKLDPCNLYNFVLHNQYTKELFVFKVRSLSIGLIRDLRFHIKLKLPECIQEGTYDYYLFSFDNWDNSSIDIDLPYLTEKVSEKGAITSNNKYIVIDNMMIVTKWFRANVYDDNGMVISDCVSFVGLEESDDESTISDIVKTPEILSSGILKYYCSGNNYNGYVNNNKEFIQYEG